MCDTDDSGGLSTADIFGTTDVTRADCVFHMILLKWFAGIGVEESYDRACNMCISATPYFA
jgi:hypothetical protein